MLKVFFNVQESIGTDDLLGGYLEKDREEFLHDYTKGKIYFDGVTNSVKEIHLNGDEIVLDIVNRKYSDYIKTNIYYSKQLSTYGSTDPYLDLMLNSFENHLGMNCLIKTSDDKYLVTTRSSDLLYKGGELSVSFSGGINGLKTGYLEENMSALLFKEAEEELGITENDFNKVYLLGIFADPERGFKRDFLFFAESNMNSDELELKMNEASDRYEIGSYEFKGSELFEEDLDSSLGRIVDMIKSKQFVRIDFL